MTDTIRLDKYLANRGICSRRDVKQLLKTQNVTINDKRVTESGARLNPRKDIVKLNGTKLTETEFVYYLVNKPKGIVSTTADELGRENVTSLVPTNLRVYPVGRLDKDTTGLIILTNDGELTHKLTHPKYHVDKVYQLTIAGKIMPEQINAFKKGVLLEDGITFPAKVVIKKEHETQSVLEVTIHEGRNRQVRRMCGTVGIKLLELARIKFGPLTLGNLKEGTYRELTKKEIQQLQISGNKPQKIQNQ